MRKIIICVEWQTRYAEDMMTWCRDNRIPVVHQWLEAVHDMDGGHVGEECHRMGTRGLMSQRYRERTGSSPYLDDEINSYFFIMRDSDYPFWKLRFQLPGDRMYVDKSELWAIG
jgi:hypothetical protein